MVRYAKIFSALNKVALIAVVITYIIFQVKINWNSNCPQAVESVGGQHGANIVLQKLKNPFRCYNNSESTILKGFYQLDCENPFLKNLSLRDLDENADVCELFNESFDGHENHTLYPRIKTEFKHFSHSITNNDILNIDAACPQCHHIQIIDGELFIVNRPTAFNFQTRSRSIKAMLNQVIETFKPVRNLEMFIHTRKLYFLK
jgi:hypothetical protein